MANWCSNTIIFKGDKQKVGEVKRLFDKLMQQETADDEGQLPDFVNIDDGYMFELWRMANMVTYETRWAPNTDVIKQIADHFEVDFFYEYAEPMNGVYGRLAYLNKEFKILEADLFGFYWNVCSPFSNVKTP